METPGTAACRSFTAGNAAAAPTPEPDAAGSLHRTAPTVAAGRSFSRLGQSAEKS